MLFLLCSIACSAAISLILKHSENKNINRYYVTTINYICACIICLFLNPVNFSDLFQGLSIALFLQETKAVLFGGLESFGRAGSVTWAMTVGILGGFLYFAGFIFIQKCIRTKGVGVTGAFSKLGIFIPVLFSLIFFKEIPSLFQYLGILLSILSIFIIYGDSNILKTLDFSLIILLLITGFGDFCSKLFQQFALEEYKAFYLFCLFFTALTISSFYTIRSIREGARLTLQEIMVGTAVGIPNLFTSYFLILALKTVKASIAFPLVSSGTIVLILAGGRWIFKERLRRNEVLAVVVVLFAILLMNL